MSALTSAQKSALVREAQRVLAAATDAESAARVALIQAERAREAAKATHDALLAMVEAAP